MAYILAGDIGGTNVRLGLFDAAGLKLIRQQDWPTDKYDGFIPFIQDFVGPNPVEIRAAAFAVAGPIFAGRSQPVNIDWVVDLSLVSQALGDIPAELVNDLVGMASFVPHIRKDDLLELNQADAEPGGTIAVIAPGTGLGEAFLGWDANSYNAYSSEGGHTDFGPTTPLQIELLQYMSNKYGRVSYERVCSGNAIPDLYNFMIEKNLGAPPDWFVNEAANAEDLTPLIFETALPGPRHVPICRLAVELFVDILGAEAGNLALKTLATGGVYVGGGIPPRIVSVLKERFMDAFLDKGRLSQIISRFPVYVITHPQPALYGAATIAANL